MASPGLTKGNMYASAVPFDEQQHAPEPSVGDLGATTRLIPGRPVSRAAQVPSLLVRSKGVDIVAVISRRVRRPGRRWWAPAVAMTFVLGLVLSACGFNVQTNLPYTPADGVNASVGTVQIRNLMILSRAEGQGYLSGTLSSPDHDSLTAVTGTVIKSDGSNGGAITATIPSPVSLGDNVGVILTGQPQFVTLTGAGLTAGYTADLTLQFSSAGSITLRVPVVDGNHPYYATVTPSATPTPSV